jgi:ubiquinone biosynthesis O-methyltransferase
MTEAEPVCEVPELEPDDYTRWRASEIGAITERLERRLILELVGDVRGLSVLDVGCGDGDLAVELSTRGANVVGIDASGSMIDAARQRADRAQADVDFKVATAQQLPFPPERFDAVVAVTILCFVDDAAAVIQEIARVLRPGGRLVIGELGKWNSWAAARRIRGWLGSPLWRKGRFRTGRELRALANNAGLEPGPVHGAIYYPRWVRAARLFELSEHRLGRLTTLGAAFLALRATKPVAQAKRRQGMRAHGHRFPNAS